MSRLGKITLGALGTIVFIGMLGGGNAGTNNAKQEIVPVNQTQQEVVIPTKAAAPSVGSASLAQPTIQKATPTPTLKPTRIPTPTPTTQPEVKSSSSDLSNDNYYTNVDGQKVHSPAKTQDNSAPAGASAICGDGTYSFSQSRRGTCSHHGGVAQWL